MRLCGFLTWYQKARGRIHEKPIICANALPTSTTFRSLVLFFLPFSDSKDKVEMALSYGATRWEAGRPVMIEAIRLAMLPTINQMSVIGLIAIPGMMTGQIIGGAPVMDAVKYQQIIMFMISASTALGVVTAVVVSCVENGGL